MVSADETAPVTGSGRNRKAEKAEQPARKTAKRTRKPAGEKPDQVVEAQAVEAQALEAQAPEAAIAIEAPVALVEALRAGAANAPSPVAPAASAETVAETRPVNLQTITDAYGDYTKKSIEQTSSFIEQLAGLRSLNSVFQLQNQFAMQAYETFVAESRRIRELHSEMTMQRLRSLEGFVAGMKPKR